MIKCYYHRGQPLSLHKTLNEQKNDLLYGHSIQKSKEYIHGYCNATAILMVWKELVSVKEQRLKNYYNSGYTTGVYTCVYSK